MRRLLQVAPLKILFNTLEKEYATQRTASDIEVAHEHQSGCSADQSLNYQIAKRETKLEYELFAIWVFVINYIPMQRLRVPEHAEAYGSEQVENQREKGLWNNADSKLSRYITSIVKRTSKSGKNSSTSVRFMRSIM